MQYITSYERNAHRKGLLQGRIDAMLELLEIRFQAIPDYIDHALRAVKSPAVGEKLFREVAVANSLEDVARALNVQPPEVQVARKSARKTRK